MARLKIKLPPGVKVQVKPKSTASKAEERFAFHMKHCGIPDPVREYRFSKTTARRWRFDFAWPDLKLAVEIEGLMHYGKQEDGSAKTGRHQTARGYQGDLDKYNTATIEGWAVLRFSQHHVKTGDAIRTLEQWFTLNKDILGTADHENLQRKKLHLP